MAAPVAVLSYSATSDLTLGEAPRIVRRADGFDEGAFTFHLGTESSLLPGSVVPGYAGMYVTEDSITDHSGDLEHDVRATGLRSGTSRLLETESAESADGFDTGSEVWAVAASQATAFLTFGRAHSQWPNLRCTSPKEKRSPVDHYKVIQLSFQGIRLGSKPPKFKVDTLTREQSKSNTIVVLTGGDSSAHNWNILTTQPTLQKSYLSLTRPETQSANVGKQESGSTAEYFPPSYDFGFTAASDDVTWQWPNGVVLGAIGWEEIPGTTICFVTEYYVRRQKIIT